MMRMWQGAVGIAPRGGLVSPAYVVARPYPETDAAYYAYLFRTAAYMRETDTFSRGIVPDRNRLYWESFKQIPSAYPPFAEQRLIVRFLDWHGVQTAKLLRAKKKLVALLHEQKQAIIHRAVTRGLDPNVKLKPSGIPWLGDVPEGWEVQRLKTVCRFIYGDFLSAETRKPGEVPVFGSNGNVGNHTLYNTHAPCIVIGRKGSFGKVNWSDQAVFAIETTYFVDDRATSADLPHYLDAAGPARRARAAAPTLDDLFYRDPAVAFPVNSALQWRSLPRALEARAQTARGTRVRLGKK